MERKKGGQRKTERGRGRDEGWGQKTTSLLNPRTSICLCCHLLALSYKSRSLEILIDNGVIHYLYFTLTEGNQPVGLTLKLFSYL